MVMRLIYITAPLWFPIYLIRKREDPALIVASIVSAPFFFVFGLFLHGSIVIYNFGSWLCSRLNSFRN